MICYISIVDDNSSDAEYIAELVKQWAKEAGYTVFLSVFPSAEAFLFEYEESKQLDILLLDIEMKGMDGVMLAKKLRQNNCTAQFIFITGFPDFIAEGYEVDALHYLMKPVAPRKLSDVLKKASANLKKAEKRLCITYDHKIDFVPLSEIYYIEAQRQYIFIRAKHGDYRMKNSLAEIKKELDEYFIQCQRSFLVNLEYVVKITNSCVVLKNGLEVPISRGMAKEIGKEMIRLF